MPLTKSCLAPFAALCLASTAASGAGPAATAMLSAAQADAVIMQHGFTPVGQPKQKGSVIGSLARLGNNAFIVTVDAMSGQFLDAKPSTIALPPMTASTMAAAAATPTNVTVNVVPAAPMAAAATPVARPQPMATTAMMAPQRAPHRHYLPAYNRNRAIGAVAAAAPTRRRLPGINVSVAALPRPSGFNRVLGPVYKSPADGYFVIDPTLGAIALDPGLFNAALAVQQGLLDPSVLGAGYSFNSGYQLGYQNGLNNATIGQLQQPMFVDPQQGPVFVNPVTGEPVVYAPSPTPGGPPQPVPYIDYNYITSPNGQPTDEELGITHPAAPVSDAEAQAAAQRLNGVPGLGTGQPLTDQQLGDVSKAIGQPVPPGGFTPQQRQDLQTIADHITPDAPNPTPALQQDIGKALGDNIPTPPAISATDQQAAQQRVESDPAYGGGHPLNKDQLATLANAMGEPTPPGGFTDQQRQDLQDIASHITPGTGAPSGGLPTGDFAPTVSAADQQAAQQRVESNPAIGSGHPIGGQDLTDIATAMGVPTPPGGFSDAERQNLQEIASHLTPADPQTLQNTAVNQAIAADPAAVNTKALDNLAAKDPAALDPNAVAAVAANQPGMVNPVTLNAVTQANPGDVSAEAIRQAAEANPGAVTQQTLSDVGQNNPGLNTAGLTTAPDSVQQQVQAQLAATQPAFSPENQAILNQLNDAAAAVNGPPGGTAQPAAPATSDATPAVPLTPENQAILNQLNDAAAAVNGGTDANGNPAAPAQPTQDMTAPGIQPAQNAMVPTANPAAPATTDATAGQTGEQPFMTFDSADFLQSGAPATGTTAPGTQPAQNAMVPTANPAAPATTDATAGQTGEQPFMTFDSTGSAQPGATTNTTAPAVQPAQNATAVPAAAPATATATTDATAGQTGEQPFMTFDSADFKQPNGTMDTTPAMPTTATQPATPDAAATSATSADQGFGLQDLMSPSGSIDMAPAVTDTNTTTMDQGAQDPTQQVPQDNLGNAPMDTTGAQVDNTAPANNGGGQMDNGNGGGQVDNANPTDNGGGQFDNGGGQMDNGGGQFDNGGGQMDNGGGQMDNGGGQFDNGGGQMDNNGGGDNGDSGGDNGGDNGDGG